MKTTSLMAGASRFAHFAGLTRSSRRAAEDEHDDKPGASAEEDEDEKDASEDDCDDDKPAGKRSRRAEDDDDRKDASEDDDDKGDDDKPAGKRSRRAEDDEDGKDDDNRDEMKGSSAEAKARRRELARVVHIITHKAAVNNPVLALSLACETRMTRKEAVAVLKSQPVAASADAGNRHSRHERQGRNVPLGSDASAPSGKQALDASWGAAFAKVGVKTR